MCVSTCNGDETKGGKKGRFSRGLLAQISVCLILKESERCARWKGSEIKTKRERSVR